MPAGRTSPVGSSLLANLRRAPGRLRSTRCRAAGAHAAVHRVLSVVTSAPVTPIDASFLRTATTCRRPRLVITGINAALRARPRRLALFSELSPYRGPRPSGP